ncbi:MAG: thioredoxin domain-containing protein [Phycisphaerales bacterium]
MTHRHKALFVVAVCVLAWIGWMRNRSHPVPLAFATKVTLDRAIADQRSDAKPVIAFYTADWCGPCEALKRGALSDPNVTALLKGMHPAFVDCTRGHPADDPFGVSGYPTLIEIRGGREISRLVGAVGTDEMLAWLDAAAKRE